MPILTLSSREPSAITLYGYRKPAKKSSERWYTWQMRCNLKASGFRSGPSVVHLCQLCEWKSSSRFLLPSFLCLPGTGGLGFGSRRGRPFDAVAMFSLSDSLGSLHRRLQSTSRSQTAALFLFQSAVFQVCQSIRASGKQCWNSTGRTPLKLSESFV